MSKIHRYLSPKIDTKGESEIQLRVIAGRGKIFRLKTGVFIKPERFRDGKIVRPKAGKLIKSTALKAELDLIREIENEIIDIERHLTEAIENTELVALTKEHLLEVIDQYHHPVVTPDAPDGSLETEAIKQITIAEAIDRFLSVKILSDSRIAHYNVLKRSLLRFQKYINITSNPDYLLTVDNMTVDDIYAFEKFLRNEIDVYKRFPKLYIEFPASGNKTHKNRKPVQRGDNTIVCTFSRLRAIFNWCNEQGLTINKPFGRYDGKSVEVYGTPYYLTLEERKRLEDFDLSADPNLEVQRDIFVFQCYIGCRVSDLISLTWDNIVNGGVEYVARKTQGKKPTTTRVPLHSKAKDLLNKYRGKTAGRKLFPFISSQKYNDALKVIFKTCGLDRLVTKLNSVTGESEKKPLYEVASSHIARRTFCGNLYKKVKDPEIVSSMSGHAPGSKAFLRYRDIDEDIKLEVINML